MDKTITVLLQLSLITPFVMLLIAALVTCGVLRGKPRWPTVAGIALTSLVAVSCLCFFSSRLEQQTYSLTLVNWLALAGESSPQLQIGVLFDPVSLAFYGLISLASLFFLLLSLIRRVVIHGHSICLALVRQVELSYRPVFWNCFSSG